MISVRVRKHFPPGRAAGSFALDCEFTAQAGITALWGPAGSGKTSILDAIAGFLRPDAGRILLDDALVFDAATGVHLEPRERRCGYILPGYALFPHLSLRRNLEFGARRLPRLERRRSVNEALERFELSGAAARKPRELNRAERFRGALARALLTEPRVLLADHPSLGACAPERAECHDMLRRAPGELEIPVLLATTDLDECLEAAERIIVLREGKVAQSGLTRQVIEQPATADVARMLGIYVLLPAEIKALDPSRNSSRILVQQTELSGPYFPGHFLGDRVWLCVRPDQLFARPRDGKPGPNQIPAELIRVTEKVRSVRLDFSGDLAVELPRAEYESQKHNKEWVVEFPPNALRVL